MNKLGWYKGKAALTLDQLYEKEADPEEFKRKYLPNVQTKRVKSETKKPEKVSTNNSKKSITKTIEKKPKKLNELTDEEKIELMFRKKNAKPVSSIPKTVLNQFKKPSVMQKRKETPSNHSQEQRYDDFIDDDFKQNYDDDYDDVGYAGMVAEEERLAEEGRREDEAELLALKHSGKYSNDF
ncbi:hypothetical protein EHI8A_104340 [Entamoeba histolytica HM-1:IMSS-B]|uniref:Uncharacterized protein n=8 Tax=Entamoeba TaxID=5758 RepID=C4LY20_ENTH1|nr:hypothetical protein ENU1_024520 [Entamoeba nuttalli P19]XP_655937.1 hypothetical protein EHI_177670 [Entamoeba histolytica HM-1:IMSS]EMD48894.1 Hypothetical protein EHI5A_141290 [Entamoeba histolytica KU27]EMH72578.1 hypothetical protein EHI8A_104340 [Entamoeba histolytica HM-1:IMSS-B]EMS11402.1 hypothetical protein KM1_172480 [Entamoeba histolytica HM-3:IMSS]ENY62973.1 hypothetical protein EHI7A_095290 [Entamoeba histolytica HM-1:IMSS-A]GAT93724.1 hypothetical protein CL6EHI_177670 [Enta|eukprot:XP_008855329.1 hypothetical protein ENU1_024520 [Entamoeba nuttalli P19]